MKAIEEGIFTATTKQRMQDLENELALLDEKIVIEEYTAQNQLTREEVFQFLLHTARKEPNLMIIHLFNGQSFQTIKSKFTTISQTNNYPTALLTSAVGFLLMS